MADGASRIKILVIGDSGVGKTSLLQKFLYGTESAQRETVGVNICFKNIIIDGVTVRLDFWDTAGQERFRCLSPQYFRGADAIVLVYDITRRETLTSLTYWLNECVNNDIDSSIPKVIIGNKNDCCESRQVTMNEGRNLCRQLNIPFFETNQRGSDIEDIFSELARRAIIAQRSSNNIERNSFRIDESRSGSSEQQGSGCCTGNYINFYFHIPDFSYYFGKR